MNPLKEQIQNATTMKELDELRVPVVLDVANFPENQKLFIKQRDKIRRHGGQIK